MKIRKSKKRVVTAIVTNTPDGPRLDGTREHTGPVPDADHLIGVTFPDVSALRRAVLASMDDEAGDALDNILLSRWAYDQWEKAATRAVRQALMRGKFIDPAKIGQERAKQGENGSLIIYCDMPGIGRVELTIPPGHWSWRVKPN